MKQHVAKVAAACFYHICHLRQIHHHVKEVTTQLVLALVISRLDYCNSLLARLPLCTTEPLQCVQNAAARLIFELSLSENITPSLLQLHWLPICWRIQFKLCCFMHAVVTGCCPAYLGSIMQPATQLRSGLRPSSSDFSVPWSGHRPSLASRPAIMPARLRGTHCHAVSGKQSILTVLGSS